MEDDDVLCLSDFQQLGVSSQERAAGWKSFDDGGRINRWDALARIAVEPNPFFESWFLLPALESFDTGESVQIFALEAKGRLVGMMPIERKWRYYGHPLPHLSTWTHANAFHGAPLVEEGFEEEFWSALFKWADGDRFPALFLHLPDLPNDSPLQTALDAVLAGDARDAATVMRQERAMLRSELSPQDYFEESLSSKKRKELRRQQRRMSELGKLQIERLTDAVDLSEWIREFLALEMKGWKGANGSALASNPKTARLFTRALTGAARRGLLERLTLRLDGNPIAMLSNFVTAPGAFSFKTAFDEDFSRFSPGVLLQKENLEVLKSKPIQWVDSCAAQDHPMIDHIWRERRKICHISVAIGGKFKRSAFRAIAEYETGEKPKGKA